MNEFISSPWFESLHTATQTPLAMLVILVTALGTWGTVRAVWIGSKATLKGGRALWTSLRDAEEAPKAQPSVPPGELCRTLLHLLEQFAPWLTAVAGDKKPVRFLTHTNGRVRIEFGEEGIDYFLAGVSLADDLTEAETALLDEAAEKRKDATLAALAACGEGQQAQTLTASEYQKMMQSGDYPGGIHTAPPVKK